MALFVMLNAQIAYSYSISGVVLDSETKKTVSNCYVYNSKYKKNAITDSVGSFRFSLGNEATVLSFNHVSFFGKQLQLNKIHSDTNIVVYLEKKVIEIGDAVVVATAPRIKTTESYSVISIDQNVIEEKIATSLIDILEEVPGITKQSEYFSPFVLRGLGGKRLLVTKDGNRRMGNFSKGFMGQSINIYDLEKVEVIKGPASVIYGPGAIAGIINMKSKYPFSIPGYSGRVLTSYGLNNNERTVLGAVNWASLDHALSFSCRYRTADDYVYRDKSTSGESVSSNVPYLRSFLCGDEIAENSFYTDKDARLAYSYEGNNALQLTIESELHLGGPWGRPIGYNSSDDMIVTNKNDDTWHSSISAVWKPEKNIKTLEASIYYDWEQRELFKDSYDIGSGLLSYREDISYENYYCGWRELTTSELTKRIELKTGTDGVYYRIKSPTELTDYFLETIIHNKVTKDAGVFVGGVFAESEYKTPENKLKLRAGLRADYSNINEGDVHDTTLTEGRKADLIAWNGTVSSVYQAWENIFISFQIARSCRLPDAKEMFICTSGSDGDIWGNSDLIPEHGLNIDAGIRGKLKDKNITFDMSLFSNFLNDFIALEYWRNSGKKGSNYHYVNVDRARIYGAELAVHMQWYEAFHPDNRFVYNSTYVYTQGDNLTDSPAWFGSGTPLRNIPPFNTKHDLTFRRILSSSSSYYLGGDVRYYANQYRYASSADGGYFMPAYCLFGASAGYKYHKHSVVWDFKLRCDNLANNTYTAFESVIYSMGRNIKAMLVITFK